MQEVAASALDQGWLVAMGRCWEEGGAPAYWPWMQVVRAVGGELERLGEALPGAAGGDPPSARVLLFDAGARVLLPASGSRPPLIVLAHPHAPAAPSPPLPRLLRHAGAPG